MFIAAATKDVLTSNHHLDRDGRVGPVHQPQTSIQRIQVCHVLGQDAHAHDGKRLCAVRRLQAGAICRVAERKAALHAELGAVRPSRLLSYVAALHLPDLGSCDTAGGRLRHRLQEAPHELEQPLHSEDPVSPLRVLGPVLPRDEKLLSRPQSPGEHPADAHKLNLLIPDQCIPGEHAALQVRSQELGHVGYRRAAGFAPHHAACNGPIGPGCPRCEPPRAEHRQAVGDGLDRAGQVLGGHLQHTVCKRQPPGGELADSCVARGEAGQIEVLPAGNLGLHLPQMLQVYRPVRRVVQAEDLLQDELHEHGLGLRVQRRPALGAPCLLVEGPVAPQHLLQVLGVGTHLGCDNRGKGVHAEGPPVGRRGKGHVSPLRSIPPGLLHLRVEGEGAGQVNVLGARPACRGGLALLLGVLCHDILGEQLLVHSIYLLDNPDQPLVGLRGAQL
mmetsp:Transcript_34061/g.106726  ORF Transcript_34061/g.106726 Transcript_34061/m.106726 type:complete len:445 (+) Transcript_34061:1418-2752(+)